jgi:hypothetical protein
MKAKTTTQASEIIRELDKQNQAIFKSKKATVDTAGFKKKSGNEFYQIREIKPGFKKNGQEFVRINVIKNGRFFNLFCNTEQTIQTAKTLKTGQTLINPAINPAGGNNFQIINFGEIQSPEAFQGYFYIHGIQQNAGYINLIAYTERKHTPAEIRTLKNQARTAKRNGQKSEFKRLIERLEKPAMKFQRIGLSREQSARIIKNYNGDLAPLAGKLRGKEYFITGMIRKNGNFTNWTAEKMELIKDFYSPEYMASMIELSDNDEKYIEQHIHGTDFEQFLPAEDPAGATDTDDGHAEIYRQISSLSTVWMNAKTEAERTRTMKEIQKLESYLNPMQSSQYEAEQNARIGEIEETLADLLPDGYKTDYRQIMKIESIGNGDAVSFYPAHAII